MNAAFLPLAALLSLGTAGHSALVEPAAVVAPAPVQTTEFDIGPAIKVLSPWSRTNPPGQKIGAVYMIVQNKSDQPVTLTAASTPVAGRVDFRQMKLEGGHIQLELLDKGVEIPAKGEVEFKPGAYLLVLVGMKKNLKVGKTFPVDLTFSDGSTGTVEAIVWDAGLVRMESK